jgi:hypothetical protein
VHDLLLVQVLQATQDLLGVLADHALLYRQSFGTCFIVPQPMGVIPCLNSRLCTPVFADFKLLTPQQL